MMIRVTTLAALLALQLPAAAQVGPASGPASTPRPTPVLKAAATVNSDLVRIGDLVDNAGASASVAIFRSPDIGTTGSVSVPQVLDAVRAHDLLVIDTRNLTEVVVTRTGQALTSKDIEGRIAHAFAGRQGFGNEKNLVVTLDREARPLGIDSSAASELQVARAYHDRRSGRFDVIFEIGRNRTLLRYTGTIVEMADVAVLMRTVGRGDVLRTADVTLERRPKAEITNDIVDAAEFAIGQAVRQPLRAGAQLRRADLMKPDLVRRDEPVTLVFEAPGVTLSMRGKALESGTEGDLVNVLNVQSKRQVQGYVAGPGRVVVANGTVAVPQQTATAMATHP
jgi:flagellar basal body P-ring formation protein FlgA